jgi:hypothetical protein
MDNLSANKTPATRVWAKKNKARLRFTPANASWANPIEAKFGPLRTFVMSSSDHPSHTVRARRLQDYLAWRNANARHPDVLAAQRRERARIRSATPATLGPPTTKGRVSNPANVHGQHIAAAQPQRGGPAGNVSCQTVPGLSLPAGVLAAVRLPVLVGAGYRCHQVPSRRSKNSATALSPALSAAAGSSARTIIMATSLAAASTM